MKYLWGQRKKSSLFVQCMTNRDSDFSFSFYISLENREQFVQGASVKMPAFWQPSKSIRLHDGLKSGQEFGETRICSKQLSVDKFVTYRHGLRLKYVSCKSCWHRVCQLSKCTVINWISKHIKRGSRHPSSHLTWSTIWEKEHHAVTPGFMKL